jgi:hypothetical protein
LPDNQVNVDKCRAERAACHQKKEGLTYTIGRGERVEFGGCAECACDDDAARKSGQLPDQDGEHDGAGCARDLLVSV